MIRPSDVFKRRYTTDPDQENVHKLIPRKASERLRGQFEDDLQTFLTSPGFVEWTRERSREYRRRNGSGSDC